MAIEGVLYIHATVADLGRAKHFYGDALGWKLHTDEPGVAGFWFGSGYLVLVQQGDGTGTRPDPGAMYVAVRVSDLESEHARLAQHGVAVSPVQRQPWGESNFSFHDPDGYRWVYSQH